MNRHRARLAAGCTALALVVTACGSDDDAGETTESPSVDSTAASPTTNQPETTAEPTEEPTEEPVGQVGSGSMSADAAAEVDAAVDAALLSAAQNGVTGFWVAIDDPDLGDYVAAYGDAAVGGPAATVEDSFRIGSVTKSFTATVVLDLVEEGVLGLDDTVQDILPDRAVDYPDLAPITVAQLLGMRSGIADYLNVPDSVVADIVDDPTRVWGTEELIAAGIDAGVMPAGTGGYSTTNYLVLELMVESLTGETLQDLIASRVTEPLGLERIFLPPDDDTDLPDPAASGYIAGACVDEVAAGGAVVDDGTETTDWNASYGQGGGGMTSDISDLLDWASSMSGNDLLSDELADRRLELTDIGGLAYGLGIMRIGAWYGHEGEAIGWEAVALHDPETGVSIAMAANGCGGLIIEFATVLDTLYPDGAALEAVLGGPDPSWLTVESTPEAPGTGEQDDAEQPDDGEEPEAPGTGEQDDAEQPEDGEEPEVPAGGADGTATFQAGDIMFDGQVVACTLDGNDVTMNVNAENAGIEVTPLGGGDVRVDVIGTVQWVGLGQATVDGGSVSIVGTGSLDDPDAVIEDFTLTAQIGAC